MNNFTIVFVHGYTASSKADFYPKLSNELDRLGIPYVIPDLPGGEHPHAKEWLEVIDNAISKITTPIILVGHSLGTRAVLLYLDQYQKKVDKVFLIAAFANRLENALRKKGKAYPDFFGYTVNILKIKSLVKKFYVLHSVDDNSIHYSQGVEIAKDLEAKLISFKNRGHFYKPENAPYILKVLRRELSF